MSRFPEAPTAAALSLTGTARAARQPARSAAKSPMKAAKPGPLAQAPVTPDSARAVALAQVAHGGRIAEPEIERETGTLAYSFDITVPGKSGMEEAMEMMRSGRTALHIRPRIRGASITRVLLAAAAVESAACAGHAPPRAAPAPELIFEGCYVLSHGPWSPPRAIPEPPTPFRLMAGVDSVGEPPFRRAVHLVRPNIARRLGIRALWSIGAGDSVRVTWSTGLAGFQLRVKPASRDTLRGLVVRFTDTRGPSGIDWGAARAEAVAVRAPCPAELR